MDRLTIGEFLRQNTTHELAVFVLSWMIGVLKYSGVACDGLDVFGEIKEIEKYLNSEVTDAFLDNMMLFMDDEKGGKIS